LTTIDFCSIIQAVIAVWVGDMIPCVDHITGEVAEKRVITTTVNKVNRLIELDIDGEIIRCTETHPFHVKGRGWVDAANLAPNDVVYTKDWNTATVKSVSLLELDAPTEVFNFEVEDCHTYFVGDNYVLVHNALCHELGKAGEKAAGIEKNTKIISMNGNNRIPDGYNPNMWVQEVKNVKSQSLTSQLKDDFIFASQNNLKMELYVRQTTHLTKPLQTAIKTFGVIVRYLP
jgi:hypothetical protein